MNISVFRPKFKMVMISLARVLVYFEANNWQILAKNGWKLIFQDKLIAKMKLSCFFIASASAQIDLFADDMLKSDFYGPISDEYQVKVQKPNDVQCCSTLKVIFRPILIHFAHFSLFWSISVHLDQSCSILFRFGQFWSIRLILASFGPLGPYRSILIHFAHIDPVWPILTHFWLI